MSPVFWILIAGGAVVAFLAGQFIYLAVVLAWEDQKTQGLGYFGLPASEREGFRDALRRHARVLRPILRLLGRLTKFNFSTSSIRLGDLAGPKGTCTEESFARGAAYVPQAEDVFVVTQMKCGTTWMQHVVYEVLHRGSGTLVDTGSALYAVSPWLEGIKSVSMEDAPLVGPERPSRIIKTHFPAAQCPFALEARYIYVARHPVSCFASCVDFLRTNAGGLAPDLPAMEGWFCSDALMWWGTWTAHVQGWWDRAHDHRNVLFVTFEEMKRDLTGVIRKVADFLDIRPLTDDEVGRIAEKCGFRYMQQHRTAFEMHPPHILAVDAELFVKGTADRHKDVPEDVRNRIAVWCARELDGGSFPLSEIYPDVAAAVAR